MQRKTNEQERKAKRRIHKPPKQKSERIEIECRPQQMDFTDKVNSPKIDHNNFLTDEWVRSSGGENLRKTVR